MKSCYLAGPMRGIEEYNFPAFRYAADCLRKGGYIVFSPAEHDLSTGFDPKTDGPERFDVYMARDLPEVCEADAVVVLRGWEDSQGARLEARVAVEIDHPVREFRVGYPAIDPAYVKRTFTWGGVPPPAAQPTKTIERHPNSARFHEILQSLAELHDRKQADYGRGDDPFANVRASREWSVAPWVGAMVRLNDKVRRLQSLLANGQLLNESAEDSFRDIAVYAIIALVLFEQRAEEAA